MKQKLTLQELELKANDIREDIIRMLEHAGSGHSAGPLGLADIFAALYFDVLKHDPKNPDWDQRDVLLLSNGHCVPVQYASMAEAGYFDKKELMTLRQIGSRLQGKTLSPEQRTPDCGGIGAISRKGCLGYLLSLVSVAVPKKVDTSIPAGGSRSATE